MNKSLMQDKIKGNLELLAPAGSFDAFRAAVENGANAVYLGGKTFNARASANNFDLPELEKALNYAHERDVKIYVTVNTLIADQEFPEFTEYIFNLYNLGVDAVIIQDLGAAYFINKVLPDLKMHASTQMTQNNSLGLPLLEEMGFSRIVLAREVSLEEIKKITEKTPMEIEVFGHGALCISYSGQCLMSSYIGGRSGNRGRCAQPCRMSYQLTDSQGNNLLETSKVGEHLLSPRDLCLIDHLSELREAGIRSVKIEGRMKRPEYVATVTRIYRQAIDALEGKAEPIGDREKGELLQVFNRDFSTGYIYGSQGKEMMSFSRPNNRGTRLGRVVEARSGRLILKLEAKLALGDGIEIWTSKGREGISVSRIYDITGKQDINSAQAGDTVQLDFAGRVYHGDRVFKTNDAELMDKARLSMREGKEVRRTPLIITIAGSVGEKLRLTVIDGLRQVTVESQSVAEEAINKPLTSEYLEKQLGRLGGTPYFLEKLTNEIKGNLIVPVKELNEMRRIAVEELIRLKKPQFTIMSQNYFLQKVKEFSKESIKQNIIQTKRNILTAAVCTTDQVKAAVKAGADDILIGGEHWRSKPKLDLPELRKAVNLCQERGRKAIWRLPRILNEEQAYQLKKDMDCVAAMKDRPAVMAANLAGLRLAREIDSDWEVHTDYFIHVFNKKAYNYLVNKGVSSVTLSTELSGKQIVEMAEAGNTQIIAFGDMEMMVSEFCLTGAVLSNDEQGSNEKCGEQRRCNMPCTNGKTFLKDRLNYLFPMETDRECRMHIFNARKLNLLTELDKVAEMNIKNIRLELINANERQTQKCVEIFREAWAFGVRKKTDEKALANAMSELDQLFGEGFTKGHFYRGVLG